MEGFRVYLYDKNGNIIGIFLAPSQKKFEADKLRYCSEYREGENFISYTEIKNPVLDSKTGKLREMTIFRTNSSENINLIRRTIFRG